MAPTLFGTDGIRAVAGEYPLDRPTVLELGIQLAGLLRGECSEPTVVLGGDTRESTPRLWSWLAAGLTAGGVRVRQAGVLPTPGVAWLVRELAANAGIVVSASHNLPPDNGIKLIDRSGFKWSPEREAELEHRLGASVPTTAATAVPPPAEEPALAQRYLAALAATVPGDLPLAGLTVALDAANGAAAPHCAALFERLGARVACLHDRPDGGNINRDCGSTHPQDLAALLADGDFDLGVAFDGDADRAVLVDERGQLRDGDTILLVWAAALLEAGALRPPRVVATTMSNLGLELALRRLGVELVRCDVGDRNVVETMQREGILLGGEQSGHVVHLGLSTAGDGLLTALQVARIVAASRRPLSALASAMQRLPQVLLNVRVRSKPDLESLPAVAEAARRVRRTLGEAGRLLLRYSGTEPLARVMIEGRDAAQVGQLAQELASVLDRELGDHA